MSTHKSRNLILVLLSLLFFACTDHHKQPLKETDFSTQRQEVKIDGKMFAFTSLNKGLPELPIRTPQLTQTMHAIITIPNFFGKIYICLGRTSSKKLFSCLALATSRDDICVRDLNFKGNDNSLRAFSGVPLDPDKRTFFPIDICVDIGKAALYYRWSLSPEDSPFPGGTPTAPAPKNSRISQGKPFPNLTLTDLKGSQIQTKLFLGKITVINWWATWCKPCVDEISRFNSLAEKYRTDASFLAIAWNSKEEVSDFLKRQEFHFTQTIGNDSTIALFGSGVPRTIVLDASGIVVLDKFGGSPQSHEEIDKFLQSIKTK
jgi:thiol-disulfide isomerase/thioredoxin